MALSELKSGKAQGPDNIPPDFLLQCGPRCQKWLTEFYSCCIINQTIPKIWREATIISLPKPNKPRDDPKSYRPISLLCVPFKLLERMILARLEPIIDPQLPNEQAGFRRGRSTVHQVVKLTNDIENCFEKGHKAEIILVDLTAAYDMVWHQGLTLKLLRMIPYRHIVRFICNILANRSFVLKTSSDQTSRPRRLRNTSTLRTSALALVYSAAEYASPAWCRSSHVKKLDVTLIDTMRLITGCLHPTPTELLPVLSGIAPAPLRREHHTHTLVTKALTSPSHLLHDLVEQSNLLGQQRLKSHHPFSRHAVRLVNSQFDICESWITDWQQVSLPAHLNIAPNTALLPGAELPRKEWVSCELVLVTLVYLCTAGDCGSQLPANAVLLSRPPNT